MDTEKKYVLKERLVADDIFPLAAVLTKIGFKEFKKCFESNDVKQLIASATQKENGKEEENENKLDVTAVGMQVVMDAVGIILANLNAARDEIYGFLAGVSNLSESEIKGLDAAEFAQMIVDVVRMDTFKDFLGVVSRLFA